MSTPELSPGHSTVLRYEGGTEPEGPAAELLAARLEIARYRERLESFVETYDRGDQTGLAISALAAGAALAAPPPSLAELRELVAAVDGYFAHGTECCKRFLHGGPHEDDCLRKALAAALAAYPYLASEPE